MEKTTAYIPKNGFWRNLATALRKMPWIMVLAHVFIRFIQPKYTVGVVGVIFNEDNHVLLVEHVFHPRRPWGLPGGWTKRSEDPAAAVQRELQEELQLSVEIKHLLLAELSERSHLDFAFLCRQNSLIGSLSNELLDYRWFSPRELPMLTRFHYQAIQRALEIVESK